MRGGLFIVLDGAETSGVADQLVLLAERLRTIGYDVDVFNFPQHDQASSYFIQKYIDEGYGPQDQVSPYTASLFYALDRYEASASIRKALSDGKIVLAKCFTGFSMAHQGLKFTNLAERRGFFLWEDSLEFELLGIPRPKLNLFLHVPADVSPKSTINETVRGHASKSHNGYENDINYSRSSTEAYETLCSLFPKDFMTIECTDNGNILSVPTINNRIWEVIKPLLIQKPQHRAKKKVINLDGQPKSESAKTQPAIIGLPVERNQITLSLKNASMLATRTLSTILKADMQNQYASAIGKYYTPQEFPVKLAKIYTRIAHDNIAAYRKLAKKITPAMAQAVLPLNCFMSFNLSSDTSGWMNALTELSNSQISEVRELAQQLAARLKKSQPKVFKDFTLPSKHFNLLAIKVIADGLSSTIADDTINTVNLVSWTPRNELDLLEDIVYSNTDLPKTEISEKVSNLSFTQKNETLAAYLMAPSANYAGVLDAVKYNFELMTDGITMIELLRTGLFDQTRIQPATPRYGYEVPGIIGDKGLEELYIKCFDDSLRLYSELQAAGFADQSQYAVLAGHKMRWQTQLSAENAIGLKYLASQLAGQQKTLEQIFEKISEVHPTIGGVIARLIPRKN